MDGEELRPSTVDPEVRAYVYSLVTALGGTSAELDGRYVLGDDALAVLKDLRRWLKHVDEKLNRLDVARSIAEANLVQGDLLQILASLPEDLPQGGLKYKVALASLDLLVTLSWPLEVEDAHMTVGHHRHMPYLQLAQAGYKRAILGHDTTHILRTIVQLTIPSMAQPRNERSARDEDIIRLALYFFRNVVQISHPVDLPMDGEEAEISRSATIDTLHDQDIFPFILTVASSIGAEFIQQDVIILEILFHLLRGIDPAKLFMEEQQLSKSNTEDFRELLHKEKTMLSEYARHAPTRHNRFGTMVWVKRPDDRLSTVSGQDILGNAQRTLNKMDKSKKWNKPKQRSRKVGDDGAEFDLETLLSPSARKHLRSFIEDFLDSSFNPLFMHLRKAIEREADRVLKSHSSQFFYLISWFLKAECARTEQKHKAKGAAPGDDEGFSLVASVLNQETFILLNRFMQTGVDNKVHSDVNAGMKCFTQILLTIQQMAYSPNEDDQDIAENIQNRIFYEEATHDRVIRLLRSYKDQGFGYLDACTELAHVFIRMLERYSKQNVDLQIRTKRRARRKTKDAKRKENGVDGDRGEDAQGADEDEEDEEDDEQEAQRTSSERKFDFMRFSARFINEGCINTFVALTRFYRELNTEQLKRAHRYFYRVGFKMEQSLLLFRADILRLFHRMIEGPNGLDRKNPVFQDWKNLVKHTFRKLISKIEERPELVVEILFSKMSSTLFYLQHGHDKEVSAPRVAVELEIRPGLDKNKQIQVAVNAILSQEKPGNVAWVRSALEQALEQRKKQEADAAREEVDAMVAAAEDPAVPVPSKESAVTPIPLEAEEPEIRTAMIKDGKLRLLLSILGLQWNDGFDTEKSRWAFPPELSWRDIEENLHLVADAQEAGLDSAETFPDWEDHIRRKTVPRQRVEFDDDSGEDDFLANDDFEEMLFPLGGPTARKSDVLDELKAKRKRLRKRGELDDEERERRAQARRKAELEKRRKIKSALFVHSSDEESGDDEEFFAKEEERRQKTGLNIRRTLLNLTKQDRTDKKRKSAGEGAVPEKAKLKKRRTASDNDDDDRSDAESWRSSRVDSPVLLDQILLSSDHSNEESEDDTPVSSHHHAEPVLVDAVMSDADEELGKDKTAVTVMTTQDRDDDSEDDMPVKRVAVSRVRAGFVVDDSDDE